MTCERHHGHADTARVGVAHQYKTNHVGARLVGDHGESATPKVGRENPQMSFGRPFIRASTSPMRVCHALGQTALAMVRSPSW